MASNPASNPIRFRDSACGRMVGALLLLYGLFNTYLFIKFTPVYSATSCGQQKASLNKFDMGDTIQVGLQIEVTCWNPNAYEVEIMNDRPGHVFVGRKRGADVGMLTLLEGSTLPAKGSGTIKVQMDTEISSATSTSLAHEFLENDEIPIFLELQFNVQIDVNFGLQSFGTTAPFNKKCGMNLGGILANSKRRIGPMICRDSFDGLLEQLPHVDDAAPGQMSFSAAQMDPDRVRMGENMKNLSIISIGGLCYFFGFLLTYSWMISFCRDLNRGSVLFPLHGLDVDATGTQTWAGSHHSWLRASTPSRNQELPKPPTGFLSSLRKLAGYLSESDRQSDVRTARHVEVPRAPRQSTFSTFIRFVSCGIARPGVSEIQPELASCASQGSGELSMLHTLGQTRSIRGRSGTLLDDPTHWSESKAAFGALWSDGTF